MNYIYNESQLILDVIGMIGVLSTGVILLYAFKRNQAYKY